MADLKEKLKEAAEGGVVDAVKNGASSMLGWLWWLIPAAGIFTYFFRDAEWMPKGLIDTLREWMGKLALLLEKTFPSLKPFLDKIFGDAAEKAAEAMSSETVRREITKDNKFSQAMADALMPDDAAKKELTRIFRENGGSIASGAAGFTPKVLAGMLTDPEGQKIITRMLPVAAAERKNPPKDSEGKVISGGADLIKNAIKGLLNDSEQFQRVASNPAAMGLLYQGAATISGVAFGEGALQQFVSAAKLTPEAQRLLFAGFIDNPQQALQNIFTNKNIPDAALVGLARNIDVSKSDESLKADITKFTALAADPAKLKETRQAVQDLGAERIAAFKQDPIRALVTESTRPTNPITGTQLAALAQVGGDQNNLLINAIKDPAMAGEVIGFVKAMEENNPGSFTALATKLANPAILTEAGQARFAAYVKSSPQKDRILDFMDKLPTSVLETGAAAKLREAVNTKTLQQLTAYADTLDSLGDTRAQNALKGALKNNNLAAALPLLMDDALRAKLITRNDQGESTVNAALANLIKVSIEPVRPRTSPTENQKAFNFLTAGGNKNLNAMLTLIDTIDKNTGNDKDAKAEQAADAANAKAMNFMIQLATGKKPAADSATIQAISTLFRKKENVDAFQKFLNNLDLNTLPPQQRAFVKVLKDNWYIDRNRNGQFDAANVLLSLDSGLAAFLAHRASAGVILEQATGRLGSFGDWMNVPVSFLTDPSLKAIREAAAKLEVTPDQPSSLPNRASLPRVEGQAPPARK